MAKEPKKPAPEAAPAAKQTAQQTAEVAPRRRRVVLWLIAAGAALGVGLLIWAKLSGLIPGSQTADPAAALEQRFATIDNRLTAFEAGLDDDRDSAGLDVLNQHMAQIEARVAEIEARPTEIEARFTEIEARPAEIEARVAEIEARVAVIAARLVEIAARPAVIPAKADLGPLEERLAALEQAFEALPQAVADTGKAADDLEHRIVALEARPVAGSAEPTPVATLLAVAQLRAALRGSGPYDAALAALEAVGGDDRGVAAALADLAPHAAVGIPTVERLRDRFTPLAEAILRAAVVAPGGSWMRRTLARLSGLVTVRRVGGDVAGESVEAIVARAEARLASGEMAAAIDEVAALDGAPAEVAASWLAQARARLAADNTLAALDARAIAAMATAAKGGG